MRRFFCIVWTALLVATLLPAANCRAAETTPVIALTQTPAYGETEPFQGVIFREDGESFDPSAYRISLYLQISPDGGYWVKPTYAQPYERVSGDGSFSIHYATGGVDETAQVIHIMLIPADYTPTESFTQTKKAALDYVRITRTADGIVTVSPDREWDPGIGKRRLELSVSNNRICVNVGFYVDGGRPGEGLQETDIRAQLNAVATFADVIRLYGSAGELAPAYAMAKELGLQVVGGAWLSGDAAADLEELDALIDHCNAGEIIMAVVGSETQYRGDIPEAKLIEYIAYVRERVQDASIPITTADSANVFRDSAVLRNACDVVFVNVYPYWNGVSLENAAADFAGTMQAMQMICGSQQVICSETGWPTDGSAMKDASVCEREAAQYFEAIRQWSLEKQSPVFFFEAADEPWKNADEGSVGSHWGFLDSNLTLRAVYASLNPFNQTGAVGSLSNYRKTAGYRSGQFRDVSDTAWYAENVGSVVEYGLMIGKSVDRFDPTGNIKVSELITLACRLHDRYYGRTGSYPGDANWYDGYVRYAILTGIIRRGQFTDYNRPATRAEVAAILTAALPFSAFAVRNQVTVIPDVPKTADYADAVYTLYRAGIIIGNNAAGVFSPNRSITRAEVAAMVTRTVDPSLRKSVTLVG